MDAREKLIMLMKKKAEEIKKRVGRNIYFSRDDKKEILRWDLVIAREVWEKIKTNVFVFKQGGLSSYVCPFCIYYEILHWDRADIERCEMCGYGARHGCCFYEDSDYRRIYDKMIPAIVFSNRWYKKVIKEIEEEAAIEKYKEGVKKAVFKNFWHEWAAKAGKVFQRLKRERENEGED
ncbi:MAG: hypothetical protein DRH24_06525 [Deltaproteobacteria bacterium]|nr:MAG: hypothetical protein DRH24_06525 [Deltaproteobacteria bacterium]